MKKNRFSAKELKAAGIASMAFYIEAQRDDLRRILKRLKAGNLRILKKDRRRIINLAREELEKQKP